MQPTYALSQPENVVDGSWESVALIDSSSSLEIPLFTQCTISFLVYRVGNFSSGNSAILYVELSDSGYVWQRVDSRMVLSPNPNKTQRVHISPAIEASYVRLVNATPMPSRECAGIQAWSELGYKPIIQEPLSGQKLRIGEQTRITWTPDDMHCDPALGGKVRIECYQGQEYCDTVTAQTAEDSLYNWMVPSALEADAE